MKRLLLAAAGMLAACAAQAESFTFVALGDIPAGDPAKSHVAFRALISEINARQPAFTIHIGDTKSGKTPCSDQSLNEQLEFMNSFDGPLIFTPGDNDWTDCHSARAGAFDPRERLQFVRDTFFKSANSLGKEPMALERQADVAPEFKTFVENARFSRDGIQFVTAHVVGSNNGFESHDPAAATEFFARDKANTAWLDAAFDKAIETDAKGLVLAIHADMFQFDFNTFNRERHLRHSGFGNFAELLVARASAFAKPVLVIHGDSHVFQVFRPYRRRAPNITALEVFGSPNMHAVEVTVDPDDPALWSIRPVLNPAQP